MSWMLTGMDGGSTGACMCTVLFLPAAQWKVPLAPANLSCARRAPKYLTPRFYASLAQLLVVIAPLAGFLT